MTRRLGLSTITVVALLALTVLGGCRPDWQNYNETLVRPGITDDNAPTWVAGTIPQTADMIYVVGRGVGLNVLDEKGAYDAAVEDATVQLAKQLATWVTARSRYGNERDFNPGSGLWLIAGPHDDGNQAIRGEYSTEAMANCYKTVTEALAGDLVARDVYWEQWYVESAPESMFAHSQNLKRYKCWVLMSISRADFDSRVAGTMAAIKRAHAGGNTMFATVGAHNAGAAAGRIDGAGASRLYRAPR